MNILNLFPSYRRAISKAINYDRLLTTIMESSFAQLLREKENQRQIQNENSRLQNKLTGTELIIQMQFDLLQRYCTVAELQQLSDLILKSRQKYGMNTKIMVDPVMPHKGTVDINEFVSGLEVGGEIPELTSTIPDQLDKINDETEALLAVVHEETADGTV